MAIGSWSPCPANGRSPPKRNRLEFMPRWAMALIMLVMGAYCLYNAATGTAFYLAGRYRWSTTVNRRILGLLRAVA